MAAGNAFFANESVTMVGGNASFAGGVCLLRMETPLRGRSGGHTGAAPTISRVAPGLKVAGEVLAAAKHDGIVVASGSPLHKYE